MHFKRFFSIKSKRQGSMGSVEKYAAGSAWDGQSLSPPLFKKESLNIPGGRWAGTGVLFLTYTDVSQDFLAADAGPGGLYEPQASFRQEQPSKSRKSGNACRQKSTLCQLHAPHLCFQTFIFKYHFTLKRHSVDFSIPR